MIRVGDFRLRVHLFLSRCFRLWSTFPLHGFQQENIVGSGYWALLAGTPLLLGNGQAGSGLSALLSIVSEVGSEL